MYKRQHIHHFGLELEPVDIDAMLTKNRHLLQGIVQKSLGFVCEAYKQYQSQVDIAAVAFSGGKDSLVLLDLVPVSYTHLDVYKRQVD